jgi:hypothetical protein
MDLAEKIRKVEALISRATSEGERRAAEFAKERLQERVALQPCEYTVRVNSPWKKKLFAAICKKYRLPTYRYKGQKYTTTMVKVSKPFIDQVLWPEFNKHAQAFDQLAEEILTGLIEKIHTVRDEEEVIISGELPKLTEAVTP